MKKEGTKGEAYENLITGMCVNQRAKWFRSKET